MLRPRGLGRAARDGVEAGRFAVALARRARRRRVASLGVLLSLIVGVSRTVFAMAVDRDLPGWLAAVHPRYRVPHRAELAVGAVVTGIVAAADVRSAIGFSSFAVLSYYAITNAAAATLGPGQRRWSPALSLFGFLGSTALAATLPLASVVAGSAVLALGALAYAWRSRRRTP